uniref:Uncharacterized protein n=1 Tax=Octopus bimaculoides TaxID=37653 RepID=A0A0L8I463_OCTBM
MHAMRIMYVLIMLIVLIMHIMLSIDNNTYNSNNADMFLMHIKRNYNPLKTQQIFLLL